MNSVGPPLLHFYGSVDLVWVLQEKEYTMFQVNGWRLMALAFSLQIVALVAIKVREAILQVVRAM